jgi:general secretion pathway protein D
MKNPVIYTAPDPTTGDPTDPGNSVPWGEYTGTGSPNTPFDDVNYTLTGSPGQPYRMGPKDGLSPIGITQNHNQLLKSVAQFSTLGGAIANTGNPALGMGLSFLDDVQVDLLIEATQADNRNTVLTAPRLTMHNGQMAWISVQTQQTYVQNLNLSTNAGAIGFTPQLGSINTGFSFMVRGVISADRRYVTMEVVFDIGDLVDLKKSDAFSAVAAGQGNAAGSSSTGAVFIEMPTTLTHRIRTTVSVPDKGTALLGGQRSVREFETEVGVPVLSKIPYINRFFTNRTTSREEKTLLILLRPEIIIQQENEEMLFSRRILEVGSSNDAFLR